MHSKLLVLTVLPAMIIAATSLAADDTGVGDAAATPRAAHREEMLKRFDANGDGRLDESERSAAREEAGPRRGFQGAFMQQYDADGDGKLSEAEKVTAQAAWKEFVAKHDADSDGRLSPDEARLAREAWAKEHPEAAARVRAAMDRDGDGEVSKQERRAAGKELRKKRRGNGASDSGE